MLQNLFSIVQSVFTDAVLFEDVCIQVDQYPNGVGLVAYPCNSFGFLTLDICNYVDGRVTNNYEQIVHIDNLKSVCANIKNIS